MEYQFTMLTVTLLTILLYGISIPLPYRRDTAIHFKNCDKNIPHVVVVNKTDGRILNCHKCFQCQLGHGLTMPCNGQNVTLGDLHMGCESCVAGVNYSTAASIQCQPCVPKTCKDGVQTVGMCESDGDKRTCKYCALKDWYYNETERICQPCSCQNMTDKVKRICAGLGFEYDKQCEKPNDQEENTTNNTPFVLHTHKRNIWDIKYTIIVSCFAGILLFAYFCCITKRFKNLKLKHPSPSACTKDWFCQIFLFKETMRSRLPCTVDVQNGCITGRACYFRQSSCPVTQEEKYSVNQGLHAPFGQDDCQEKVKLIVNLPHSPECELKNLRFFEMNNNTCQQICKALRYNIDTGMGYPTLAGLMGFSANKVKDFKEKEDPCEEMFSFWDHLNKENTVLKLQELVVELKRDDILQMIKKELKEKKKECKCRECSASN